MANPTVPPPALPAVKWLRWFVGQIEKVFPGKHLKQEHADQLRQIATDYEWMYVLIESARICLQSDMDAKRADWSLTLEAIDETLAALCEHDAEIKALVERKYL